jgi:hypothetical protein
VRQAIRLLRIVGWVLALGGSAAALKTWLDLRDEQRLHAYQTIPLDLATLSEWQEIRVTPSRPGRWRISLTTVNAFSRPNSVESTPYNGALEVQVLDPRRTVHWTKVLDGPSSGHSKPANMAWTELAAIHLGAGGDWTLRARVLRRDAAFDRTFSEVRAYPPQVHDMGWYPFEQTVKIVLWGLLCVMGVAMVTTARVLRRRRADIREPAGRARVEPHVRSVRPAPNTFSSSYGVVTSS